MGKEKFLYILVGVLFVAYVLVEYYEPKPIDWTITYSEKDKNPYGGYILYQHLDDFFTEKEISFETLYEMSMIDKPSNEDEYQPGEFHVTIENQSYTHESQDSTGNLLIIAERFQPSKVDIEALFEMLGQGNNVLVSASFYSQEILDTLNLKFHFDPLRRVQKDTSQVRFNNQSIAVPSSFLSSALEPDSSDGWNIYAKAQYPVIIGKYFGEGQLILCSTPLFFTNYGLLQDDYHQLAAVALRQLPEGRINYSRFYQSGKPEPRTPLRYLLSQAPLRWAVYLSLFTLIAFLIIASRRRQRAIPVLNFNRNTTVDFIRTIGGLYHRSGDHKNAAAKLISRFLKTLSAKYHIQQFNEKSFHIIASKTGVPVDEVIKTFTLIDAINAANNISEERLKELYNKINKIQ